MRPRPSSTSSARCTSSPATRTRPRTWSACGRWSSAEGGAQRQEARVQAWILGELGMEGGGEHARALQQHGFVAEACHDARARADGDEARRADEEGRKGLALEVERPCEGVELGPVGVAFDARIEELERGWLAGAPRQEDRAGTGAEERELARAVPRADRLPELEELEQTIERRRFAAGQDEV